ncbi:MAG: CobQ/CobB/MinD/ParA nucleotide binding domain-containing protein [Chloroflexota bacterium]|nr:MAG: CobQ/CobB/MinD/ParA nucleotide binding domain-containing protein [Chloroflexota bacterium]
MTTQNPLRVLIVDDSADTRENLMRLLAFEDGIEVIGAAPDGRLGVEAARRGKPDIVLMDLTMPTMDGIAAAEAIRVECPSTHVVMMSVHDEPEALRRAMLAGAREFLVKPFGPDELVATLNRVAERRAADRAVAPVPATPGVQHGRMISVFGPKGGVGRTTVACNLAVAIRQTTGQRVALVDANLQFGDVGIVLGLKPTKSIVDLVPHIAEIDADLLGEVVSRHHSGIDVLLAPPRPEMAELVTADYLKRILGKMREAYDVVVVDTAPNFSETMLATLDISDRILVLLTVEMHTIKNTRLFLEVAGQLGYPREKLTLVLNRADSTGGIEITEIERALGHRVNARIVSDGRTTTYALNHGEPFVIANKKADISRNVFELANLVMMRAAPVEEARVAPSGISRLLPFRLMSRSAAAGAR